MAVTTRLGPHDASRFLHRLEDDFKIKPDDLPKPKSVEECRP